MSMAFNLVYHIHFRADGVNFCSIAVRTVCNTWFNLLIIHFTKVDIFKNRKDIIWVRGLICEILYILNMHRASSLYERFGFFHFLQSLGDTF
ncbi:hypothetical protein OIU78_018106 [Salix suchowensis]|nr:hypothetical protein OIU78_018106 [Salix suchowensis]